MSFFGTPANDPEHLAIALGARVRLIDRPYQLRSEYYGRNAIGTVVFRCDWATLRDPAKLHKLMPGAEPCLPCYVIRFGDHPLTLVHPSEIEREDQS